VQKNALGETDLKLPCAALGIGGINTERQKLLTASRPRGTNNSIAQRSGEERTFFGRVKKEALRKQTTAGGKC